MKRYGFCLLFILSIFLIWNVDAQDIKKITMDINVDKEGTAHVKENWTIYFDKDEDLTEVYKTYNNIGKSEFKNFKVSLKDKKYSNIKWNINESFNNKKYKNGINYTKDGIELCWGISEKSKVNTYNISYDITNFVAKLNDADMVYWTLVPKNLNDSPENVYIKIYSDFEKYSKDLPVWGFGKYGAPTYVYDGYIEMSTNEVLESYEYMTILIKYPKDTFNNKNTINQNFNYYLDMAQDNSTTYTSENGDSAYILDVIGEFLPYIIILILIVICIFVPKYRITGSKRVKLRKEDKKLPKDVNYIRNIPCNKDIYRAYWISKIYRLNRKDTDLLGAVLLKWLNENKIEIHKETKKGVFKKEQSKIILKKDIKFENPQEEKLYKMLTDASGDYVLEAKEFKKWASDHYTKVLGWFETILDEKTEKLEQEKIVEHFKKDKYISTNKLYNEAIILKGFKKFLLDFSRIYEKEPLEVHLWKEYLMFAQVFGIAEKVAKDFKNIYPDLIPEDYIDDFDFIYFVAYTGINSANTARTRAESYDSGGGGFSSGGGGFGSFGGGSFGGGGGR